VLGYSRKLPVTQLDSVMLHNTNYRSVLVTLTTSHDHQTSKCR